MFIKLTTSDNYYQNNVNNDFPALNHITEDLKPIDGGVDTR